MSATDLTDAHLITAVVVCHFQQTWGKGGRYGTVSFPPARGEHGLGKPNLELRMTVRGDAADRFERGQRYTLTLRPNRTPDDRYRAPVTSSIDHPDKLGRFWVTNDGEDNGGAAGAPVSA